LESRSAIRALVAVVCLAATGLGLNNTYGDDSEVKALAQKAACGSPSCSVKLLRESRSAFSESFSFQTTLVQKGKSGSGASVDVKCKRKQILFGDYECNTIEGANGNGE
jgi:hypothetical protein